MLGEVIHGYRIDRALSGDKGGFGDVFFAVHVNSGAEAVIKVLKPEMSAMHDIVARFFNEARAAASVHHPGIVQIHNVGYHGDRAYLLMERLHGEDLETRLTRGPLPLDRAVIFVRQTAGAIGAAHERGIVHRDLKPANLFIVADPDVVGGERIKVLDFGIAKLSLDAGAGKTQGVFGTPAYMSPEQCASTGAVDGRSDLYSLGCIFYELVCGRPPFGQGGIELIAAHLRDAPQPPRMLAPQLPPAIEQVILRLLEKQPDQRFPSCAALIAALDDVVRLSGQVAAQVLLPSGMPAASVPAGAMPLPSVPVVGAVYTQPAPRTTLASSAGVATTRSAGAGRNGLWIGVGAIVVVGGAIAVIAAAGGGASSGPGTAVGDAGSAVIADTDAGANNDAGGAVESEFKPSAAFRAYAAAVLNVPPGELIGGLHDAEQGSHAEHTHGGVWAISMTRSGTMHQVRGWVMANGTIVTPKQNLGMLFSEAGVWANPPGKALDDLADTLADDLIWSFGPGHKAAIEPENNLRAPKLVLEANGVGHLRFFSVYQQSGGGGSLGPLVYSEVEAVWSGDHAVALSKKPFDPNQPHDQGNRGITTTGRKDQPPDGHDGSDVAAISEPKPIAAFRAYAAKALRVPPAELEGGFDDEAAHDRADTTNHTHGAARGVVLHSKDGRQVRGWVTVESTVITPNQNLGILFEGAGVWAQPATPNPDWLASVLAKEIMWSFGPSYRVGIDYDHAMPGPALTLANGAGTLRFFLFLPSTNPAAPYSFFEIIVALTASHKATLTKKPFQRPSAQPH